MVTNPQGAVQLSVSVSPLVRTVGLAEKLVIGCGAPEVHAVTATTVGTGVADSGFVGTLPPPQDVTVNAPHPSSR
jgi:hypothetical protein